MKKPNRMYAIFACDKNWGIGKDGKLPWPNNKDDMAWFKNITNGNVVIMGRKTYESLPSKNGLPNRLNIVITSQPESGDPVEDYLLFRNLDKFLESYPTAPFTEGGLWKQFCIGGSQLFDACKDHIDTIWITRLDQEYDCDTHLDSEWITENFTKKSIQHAKLNLELWERKNTNENTGIWSAREW